MANQKLAERLNDRTKKEKKKLEKYLARGIVNLVDSQLTAEKRFCLPGDEIARIELLYDDNIVITVYWNENVYEDGQFSIKPLQKNVTNYLLDEVSKEACKCQANPDSEKISGLQRIYDEVNTLRGVDENLLFIKKLRDCFEKEGFFTQITKESGDIILQIFNPTEF